MKPPIKIHWVWVDGEWVMASESRGLWFRVKLTTTMGTQIFPLVVGPYAAEVTSAPIGAPAPGKPVTR